MDTSPSHFFGAPVLIDGRTYIPKFRVGADGTPFGEPVLIPIAQALREIAKLAAKRPDALRNNNVIESFPEDSPDDPADDEDDEDDEDEDDEDDEDEEDDV